MCPAPPVCDYDGDLPEPVEGNPSDKDIGEKLEQGEEREHDPIGQPLGVVLFHRRL